MGLLSSSKSKSGAAEAGSSTGVSGELSGSTNPINIQDTVSINLSAGDDLGSNTIVLNKVDLGSVNRAFNFAEKALNDSIGAVEASSQLANDSLSELKGLIEKPPNQNLQTQLLLLAGAAIFAPLIAKKI